MFYAKIFAETRVAQISGKHINNVHQDFNLDIPSSWTAAAWKLVQIFGLIYIVFYLTMLYYLLSFKNMHKTTTY